MARRSLAVAAAFLALSFPALVSAQATTRPSAQEAQALLSTRPDLVAQLRQRLMTSGMTPEQVRARLRAEGYPETLLDAYLPGGAASKDSLPTNDVFDAVRALGISDSTDVEALRVLSQSTGMQGKKPTDRLGVLDANSSYSPIIPTAAQLREDSLMREQPYAARSRLDLPLFGANLFRSSNTEFQPNLDGPVDANYKIGPGDRLMLILTGEVEKAQTLDVTREGFVLIPDVGQVPVANLTISALEDVLYGRLGRVYSGVRKGPTATTHFQISMVKLRSNQVFVVGDVMKPGSYRVSSAGTAMTALYAAGGPSDNGTFRTISVRRGGKEVGTFDLYDYLLRGDASKDLRLESGDIVFVGTHGARVRIAGEITRSAIYELKPGETLNDLVTAAGGLTASASRQRIQIERVLPPGKRTLTGGDRTMLEVTSDAALGTATISFPLEAGDYVRVFGVSERVRNRLKVTGNVWRSGMQAFSSGLTLSEVLRRAGGAKPDTYLGQVLISRLMPDSTRSQLHAILRDTTGAVLGTDPVMADDDEITVFSITDFRPNRFIAVTGAVRKPGQLPYHDGMTLRDALLLAGGTDERAYLKEVEIARIPTDRTSGTLAHTFRVPLDSTMLPDRAANGRLGDPSLRAKVDDVVLQPFDNILVMMQPDWRPMRSVVVTGEVQFPGRYAIRDKSERIRDLIARAGGLNKEANLDGAFYARSRSATTYQNAQDSKTKQKADSLTRVGIDLGGIMAHGDIEDNLLLEAGDSLDIPRVKNTVEVRGAVNAPTIMAVSRGASLEFYIRAAGGGSTTADAGRSYVVQPNGKIESRRHFWFWNFDPTPRPGATVTVPARDSTNTAAATLQTFSTLTQILATVLTAAALLKR